MIDLFRGKYNFLSNLYECKLTYEGLTYHSAEAAYQAQKCITKQEKIKFTQYESVQSIREAYKIRVRSDWEDVRIKIMYQIVRCKFTQNPDLALKLRCTGCHELVEGYTNNRYWGRVGNEGHNYFGKILMKVREEIK